MAVSSALLVLFGITGLLMYRHRRQRAVQVGVVLPAAVSGDGVLVAYASQTGTAERLARATAAAFPGARLLPLDRLNDAALADTRHLLLVASTYGEGEPPDHVRLFERRMSTTLPAANGIGYAVLALGDREYAGFCTFGRRLDGWMGAGGGHRLFDTVELDGVDPAGQRIWAERLTALGASAVVTADPPYAGMRIVERERLNRGSAGGPVHRIVLEPSGERPDWRPGDLAEVLPPGKAHGPMSPRAYSISSLATSGCLELIVRLHERSDGGFGAASGHLVHQPVDAGPVRVRLRINHAFHGPDDPSVPLILIGSGTGLAGLLAHIRKRAEVRAHGHRSGPVWLAFGERNAATDALLDGELQHHLRTGTLTRMDRSWSRDADCPRYVQDALAAQTPLLRAWLDRGATMMVCGSANGMAQGVDRYLREIVGDRQLDELAAQHRYVRDIY